jgi:triosephosphate isomerase
MHMVSAEARELSRELLARFDQPLAEVVLFPSALLLPTVAEVLAGSPLAWGGQDIHVEDSGAYTGDVSGPQLADVGCTWALCGHSERRRDHCESDELVGKKALAANRNGLTPLICLGETLAERQDGDTFSVLERQPSPVVPIPLPWPTSRSGPSVPARPPPPRSPRRPIIFCVRPSLI